MRFQKIVCTIDLILAAVFFVLGLGYSTNLYNLYYFIDPTSVWYVPGSELYYTVQDFNHREVVLSIIFILLACSCFLAMNNTRRKYYITNFITSVGYSGFAIAISIYVYSNVTEHLNLFLTTVDFEKWHFWVDLMSGKLPYNDSTFWFTAGKLVALSGLIGSALCLSNMIWKIINMVREKKAIKLLNGEA